MRKSYLLAMLLILLAATAVSMALVTSSANALPTFNVAQQGVGPCDSCHSLAATHAIAGHATAMQTCSPCHGTSTANPPLPSACASCHGATAILASATHALPATGCATTAGCHGVVSPTPTPTTTPTPTPTPIVTPKATLALSGFNNGVVKLGRSVMAKGKVTPTSLAGKQVKITVQKKSSGKWMMVKSAMRTIRANGTYSWSYKPAKSGTYRMRTTIARTSTNASASTPWRGFKAVNRIVIPDFNG